MPGIHGRERPPTRFQGVCEHECGSVGPGLCAGIGNPRPNLNPFHYDFSITIIRYVRQHFFQPDKYDQKSFTVTIAQSQVRQELRESKEQDPPTGAGLSYRSRTQPCRSLTWPPWRCSFSLRLPRGPAPVTASLDCPRARSDQGQAL